MDAINGDSTTPKRRKLMDFFPEVPASERFLRQYQPTDVVEYNDHFSWALLDHN